MSFPTVVNLKTSAFAEILTCQVRQILILSIGNVAINRRSRGDAQPTGPVPRAFRGADDS